MKKYALSLGVALASLISFGATVSESEAKEIAEKWKDGGATVASVTACTAGAAKYYVAAYAGGGFALVAGDDRVDPVIFFSPKGTYRDDDSRNPLLAMIKRDFEERWNAAGIEADAASAFSVASVAPANAYAERNRAKWAELRAKPTSAFSVAKVNGDDDLEDIRVPKLVQSYWDQECGGGQTGTDYPCYNYYTPSNICCGCVATAFAQTMRFHEWPQAAVTPISGECEVAYYQWGSLVSYTTNTLAMAGGVYDWANMPLEPQYYAPETQRQAIGKLCSDIGIAFGMNYNNYYGSSANAGAAITRLKGVFGYAQSEAIFWSLSLNMTSYDANKFQQMVVPSLEAGLPCVLTIYGDVGGHEVVCDGYGYQNGEFYVHINAGYTGWGDAWYCPPYFDGVGGYTFTSINGINFNISPTNSNPLIQGRIIDENNAGVAGATVTLKLGSTVVTNTTTSNAKGSYVFYAAPGTYTVEATKGSLSASCSATVSTPVSSAIAGDGQFDWPYATVNVGNSVWNNIVLSDAEQVATPVASQASNTRFTGSLSVAFSCATAGAKLYYTTDGSTPTSESTLYSSALTLTEGANIKVRAYATGMTPSETATFVYIETTLADALDCPNLPWITESKYPFSVQTTNVYAAADNTSALQSYAFLPYANTGSESKLWTWVTGPATLNFKYTYVSANNPFTILLDDDTTAPLFTKKTYQSIAWTYYFTSWTDATVEIPEGQHKVTFMHHYDYGTMNGTPFYGICLDQVVCTYTGDEPTTPKVSTPSAISTGGTEFEGTTYISLECPTADVTIYYTLDGSTPTTSSAIYSGLFSISETTTLKAYATRDGYDDSDVLTLTLTKLTPAATPTASPASGATFTDSLSVTLASATSGATIRYTLDGSTPISTSTAYTGAIALSATTTIKAIAYKDGMAKSGVLTATYTKTAADPVVDDDPEEEHEASEVVTTSPLADAAIDDIRVGALIDSRWTQTKTVSPYWGDNCFNYYTPDNTYCSCGATALAQIMRYHRYPNAEVQSTIITCLVDEVSTELELVGGVYNWDLMPPIVSTTVDPTLEITEAQRQAIGRLCSDVGVAMRTSYYTGNAGSGSDADMAMIALPKRFGYGSTKAIAFSETTNLTGGYTEELFKNIVIPNLDAGLPVVLSASGAVAHIFICDGYGYKNGKLYVHLNLGLNDGLSGTGYDGWYQPTKIWPNAVSYWWNHITGAVFNISPERIDSICSGRILDASGNPVEGATIKVMYGDWPLTNVTSNAKGIYAFFAPGGGQYKLTASKDGAYGRIFKTIDPVVPTRIGETGFHDYGKVHARVGNSCGNDITLKKETMPTVAPTLDNTLGDAIGTTNINWVTSEDLPWTVVTDNSSDGVSALKSQNFGSYETPLSRQSWLEGAIAGPATLSFKYEYGRGYNMTFSATVDGETVFTHKESYGNMKLWDNDAGKFTIPAGVHEVKFIFCNDTYSSTATNAAWLDAFNLEYTATPPEPDPDPTFDDPEPDPDPDPEEEQVETPTITRMDMLEGNEFSDELTLSIWCDTDDAEIYYTTDGSEPTTASEYCYGYIYLNDTATVKIKAFKDGMTASETVTATYTKIVRKRAIRIMIK